MKNFNYGLIVPGEGRMGSRSACSMKLRRSVSLPAALPPAIRPLPPSSEWVNVHSLGVKGDGTTDDTAAFSKPSTRIACFIFPSGHYVVRDTLALKPDTVLIGLHPTLTQIDLLDETPGFRASARRRP